MSGNVWMFSDEIDDEDLEFMRHDYVTYNMACEYYRLGIKPVVRMAHEAGAVYKIGKKVLIRRSIFEAYLREKRKILLALLKKSPNLVTKHELCNVLWGTEECIDENALQVTFTRLRKTLREFGLEERIETVRGQGYRLKEQVRL